MVIHSRARRSLTCLLLAGLLGAAASLAHAQGRGPAQDYPSRPIHIIVPFAPGGSTTTVARLIGQNLTERWGQPVVVENRAGGNSSIGTEALARSPADGYTILLVVSTHVINPLVMKLPYDTFADFAPICTIYSTEYVLVVNPEVQANNLAEFVALARARPGQLSYGAGDNGGVTHLASELFNLRAGVRIQGVPYKGAGPALADTLGGHVQMFFGPPIVALPHIKSGKLRALAVSGTSRVEGLPDVPTFEQAGLTGVDVTTWYGLLAPAHTPPEIVGKLAEAIRDIMGSEGVRSQLRQQGLEPYVLGPADFDALMHRDMAKFESVIKTANIKFD